MILLDLSDDSGQNEVLFVRVGARVLYLQLDIKRELVWKQSFDPILL